MGVIVEAGFCAKCGKPLDDHVGWLTKEGPRCPKAKGK